MKLYTAIIVVREYVWTLKADGSPVNPTANQKMLQGFVDKPAFEAYNVYTKVGELKADRLADLGHKFLEYTRDHADLAIPYFAPGNTTDFELIITHKGKTPTGNVTNF